MHAEEVAWGIEEPPPVMIISKAGDGDKAWLCTSYAFIILIIKNNKWISDYFSSGQILAAIEVQAHPQTFSCGEVVWH